MSFCGWLILWGLLGFARRARGATPLTIVVGAAVAILLMLGSGAAIAGSGNGPDKPGKDHWHTLGTKLPASPNGAKADVQLTSAEAVTLDRDGLASMLAGAQPDGGAALVVSLPDPSGSFQRFSLHKSDLMAPGLAEKHPEISTYSGVGLDDPTATIHADLSPLGFHASVRAQNGAWYIDPVYHLDQSVYASYYGRNVKDDAGTFVERDADAAEVSVDEGYYHAADTVTLRGSGFESGSSVSIAISDPEEHFATRTLTATSRTGWRTSRCVAGR